MATTYTKVAFTNRQPNEETAVKLNRLRDDLSAAISAGGTGTGDMTKAVYDTNNNGVVDTADSLAWSKLTGVPIIGDMTKAVYDTNANGVVDTCDALAWSKLSGVPASFTPSAHAATHLAAGTDPIAVATATLAGLCPAVDNITIQIVASKLSCVALAWTAITGKPTTFAPSAHAGTHQSGGADPIPLDTLAAASDITALNASATAHGLLPKLANTATKFLRDDGTWQAIGGGGDMLKSTYDTNNNGVVDSCDSLAWSKLTGVPATFPPDPTAIWKGFIAKTAAYTLLSADSGKYIICSGGSWVLTLPTPALGLFFKVRNDMGISGTTGTITLQPAGGTIDGVASLPLLAQQEVQIITDGTNWRTCGRQRDLVLGTQDLSSVAQGVVVLPPGYRHYRFNWENLLPVTNNAYLQFQISTDGGNTFLSAASYTSGNIYNVTGSAVASQYTPNVTAVSIANTTANAASGGSSSGLIDMILWPGDGNKNPNWMYFEGSWNATPLQNMYSGNGFYNSNVIVNAIRYYMNTGNIATSLLTVKGVV